MIGEHRDTSTSSAPTLGRARRRARSASRGRSGRIEGDEDGPFTSLPGGIAAGGGATGHGALGDHDDGAACPVQDLVGDTPEQCAGPALPAGTDDDLRGALHSATSTIALPAGPSTIWVSQVVEPEPGHLVGEVLDAAAGAWRALRPAGAPHWGAP